MAKHEINRRDLLKGAGIGMMGMLPLAALAGCAPTAAAEAAKDEAKPQEAPTAPEHPSIEVDKDRKLTLEEVNALRKDLIDSKTDYVCADGTVIPAAFVKVRTLINSIGLGVGSVVNDQSFDMVMHLFSEEEAETYLELPRGVEFTAAQYAVESGRDEEAALEICENFASRGLLFRVRRAGIARFHLLPQMHGIWEYNVNVWDAEWLKKHFAQLGEDKAQQFYNSETPIYVSCPVNKDVVGDEGIIGYDDYEKIIRRNTVLAVSDCQCRKSKKILGTTDPACDHPLETCISAGEEAQFYIENGAGREITQEEALAIVKRSVDAGMVIQHCHSKDAEVICSCHGDCCGILSSYVALAPRAEEFNLWPNVSHYTLKHDKDACIKCGACEKQCPLFAITMDDEGYPAVNLTCVRCGQCATVCPAGARTLFAKDTYLDLPQNLLDDHNMKAEYRFRHGMVY